MKVSKRFWVCFHASMLPFCFPLFQRLLWILQGAMSRVIGYTWHTHGIHVHIRPITFIILHLRAPVIGQKKGRKKRPVAVNNITCLLPRSMAQPFRLQTQTLVFLISFYGPFKWFSAPVLYVRISELYLKNTYRSTWFIVYGNSSPHLLHPSNPPF